MSNYPTRFDPEKRYFELLAPDHDFPWSSGDINDGQAMQAYRTKTVGDAMLRDGNVVRGGAINVNQDNGETIIGEAGIYLDGMVHKVRNSRFVIPIDRVVSVGVCVTSKVITHLEDPELKLDVAGAEDYGEPTTHRRQTHMVWSWKGAGEEAVDCAGRFYSVYEVNHGVVIDQTPPPQFDPLNSALARYDREKNGHYIVSGWQVRALGSSDGVPALKQRSDSATKQTFSIAEGTVNVWGNKITRDTALRLTVAIEPDLQEVEAEPHQVPSNASGEVSIIANHTPIIDLLSVTVIREKSISLTHGPYRGALDPLPDNSVSEIIQISQAGTTYTANDDYVLNGDQVDWRADGFEPAPGSSYEITYRTLDRDEPTNWDENGVVISDVVPGSTVILNYKWALPRVDAVCVDRDGNVSYLKGQASSYAPWAPEPAADQLRIAQIVNRWGHTPEVRNSGTRAVHNNTLELHGSLLYDLLDLVAHERLKRDMDAKQPTTKRGIFTDPFLDDDMRDQGLAQTGAIVGGALQLPISGAVTDIELGSDPILLPFIEEEVVVQNLASDCHKINPYQMFEPLPARVTLTPAVDIWTEHRTAWASDFTQRFTVTENISRTIGAGNRSRTTSETSSSESTVSRSQLIGTDRDELAFIRVRDVGFRIEGFGAGELLEEAVFDGVDVTRGLPGFPLAADDDGHIEGTLTIPDNIPAGAKEVAFTGKGGSQGTASYVGRGIIETATWRNVFTTTVRRTITTTTRRWRADPVAQSFMLREGRHITGLSVKFCSIGNRASPVILQTRNTDNGFPAQSVIGEGVLEMGDVTAGEWTKLDLSGMPFLAGATRFANVLMSDDGEHAVSIARLGGFDAQKQQHVSAQPYSVGVFFDGSLAEAWKPHHDKDLTFKLHAARFTSTYREVSLGEITLVDCSDLIVSCGFEEPATGCSVTIRITRANGEIIRTRPGRPIRFDEHLNETVDMHIELRGSELASPVLYPFVQVLSGNLQSGGDYISRAMPADPGSDNNVVITFDCLLPARSDILVSAGQPDNWQQAVLHGATPLGDGWQERSYKIENIRAPDVRARLALSGNAGARPFLRNLRANVTRDPVNIITDNQGGL